MSYLRSQFVAALVVCAASLSYSQSQATCTFNLFQAPGLVNGVNDFRTTVGENSQIPQQAFVRYSGGGFFYFSGQVALATSPMARNDGGVTVGPTLRREQDLTRQRVSSSKGPRLLPRSRTRARSGALISLG